MVTLGVSPKLIAAVVGAVLGYLATQQVLDLPAWADLIVQCATVALGAFLASPGTVAVDADDVNARLDEGQSVVEMCFALAFLALAIWILAQVF